MAHISSLSLESPLTPTAWMTALCQTTDEARNMLWLGTHANVVVALRFDEDASGNRRDLAMRNSYRAVDKLGPPCAPRSLRIDTAISQSSHVHPESEGPAGSIPCKPRWPTRYARKSGDVTRMLWP